MQKKSSTIQFLLPACYICGSMVDQTSCYFWHRLRLCSDVCLDIIHEKNDTEANQRAFGEERQEEYQYG